MNGQNAKTAYRLPPCPSFDVEGTESWLEDMAAEGLLLAKDGFMFGLARFARQRPQRMKYRLAAAPEKATLFNDCDTPPEEQVALSAALGWDYVGRRGSFYIFRTLDPKAGELDTDPQVQALALKTLERQERNALIVALIWVALFLLVRLRGSMALLAIGIGTGFFLFSAAMLAWLLLGSLFTVLHLEKLRRRLKESGALDHRKNWRKHSVRYWVTRTLKYLLLLLWIVLFCIFWRREAVGVNEIPLTELDGTVPFATLADFSDGSYRLEENLPPNSVKVWSDILAPVSVEWREHAVITLADGSAVSCIYYADYHEAANPWLARRLGEEYLRADRRGDYEALEPPAVDADWCAAYLDDIHFPNLILQKGDRVIHVMLVQLGEEQLPLEVWADILAESLRSGDS